MITKFYTLPSGESRFKSLEEINTEVQIFQLDATENKEKAARILGAVG